MGDFLEKNQKLLVFSLFGLALIGLGLLFYKTGIALPNDKVEILNSTTESQDASYQIVVEISGSIEKPGVYKLLNGSRVEDLLVTSGGLSVNADREWVSKNINRASKLSDGQKVYIYSQSEVKSAKESGGIKIDQPVLGSSDVKTININSATQNSLESLPGIGPVYAQSIIEHRPYSSLSDLVSKGVINQKTFEKIKEMISL